MKKTAINFAIKLIALTLFSVIAKPVYAADCPRQCDSSDWNENCPVEGEKIDRLGFNSERRCFTTVVNNQPQGGQQASGTKTECLDCDGDCKKHNVTRSWQNATYLKTCVTRTYEVPPGVIPVQLPPPNLDPPPVRPHEDSDGSIEEDFCQKKTNTPTNDDC